MVEDVESLGSELELQVFIEGVLPAYCQVHLPCAETSRKVARCGPLTRRTGRAVHVNKSVRIDRPATRASLPGLKSSYPLKNRGAIRAIEVKRLALHNIQPFIKFLAIRVQEPEPG